MSKLERSRLLFSDGILARTELGSADTRAFSLVSELAEAEQRPKGAIVDHRRSRDNAESELDFSRCSTVAAQAHVTDLRAQLQATRRLSAHCNTSSSYCSAIARRSL